MTTYPEACADPNLFGPWFEGDSWATWRVVDKALFGLPLDASERRIFRKLTGRKRAPTEPITEAWFAFGRRSGKDVKAASLVTYLATIGAELYGYRARLTRGERGVVQLLAVDRDQAQVCLGYCKAMFEQPLLASLVKRVTAETIELTNSLAVEITTNDQRRARGRTVIACVFDEVAHWKSDNTTNPDEEVYESIMPSMATIPNALLIGISSPHARRGLLFKKFERHWGRPGPVLTMRGPTWLLNPTLPRTSRVIREAYRRDPSWANAEFGAEWRSDIEAFLSPEAIQSVIASGVRERAPETRVRKYFGFVDCAGGSGRDSMTMAVAHREQDMVVLDCIREVKPPFSPEAVVEQFASLFRSYRVTQARADRYAADWPKEQFKKRGVTVLPAGKSKSEIYLDLLPVVNSAKCVLLDHPKLVAQLSTLERTSARGRGDIVDAPKGQPEDVANAVAGVIDVAVSHDRFATTTAAAPSIYTEDGGWRHLDPTRSQPKTTEPATTEPPRSPLAVYIPKPRVNFGPVDGGGGGPIDVGFTGGAV